MPDHDSARPAGHAVDSARSADHAVARQQEEELAVENSLSLLQLEDTVNRSLPEQQVLNFRPKPEMEIETSELPARASYVQQCCREEPVTKPELEIKGEESLPHDDDNLAHDDVHEDTSA